MNDNSWANFALTGDPMAYLKYKQRSGSASAKTQAKDFTGETNQSPRPRYS